jgi:predicted RNA-binding Zn-ribbon protein involved in translation (DUF1610 family)
MKRQLAGVALADAIETVSCSRKLRLASTFVRKCPNLPTSLNTIAPPTLPSSKSGRNPREQLMDGSRCASLDLDWSYGRQYPRSRTQRDRRSRFFDKKSRQGYREWARRRSQHHHPRRSAAFREQVRVRHAFFIQSHIDARSGRLYSNGIAARSLDGISTGAALTIETSLSRRRIAGRCPNCGSRSITRANSMIMRSMLVHRPQNKQKGGAAARRARLDFTSRATAPRQSVDLVALFQGERRRRRRDTVH